MQQTNKHVCQNAGHAIEEPPKTPAVSLNIILSHTVVQEKCWIKMFQLVAFKWLETSFIQHDVGILRKKNTKGVTLKITRNKDG